MMPWPEVMTSRPSVAKALADGLSWRHITAALNAHDARQRSVAGVHKRYRHLAEKPPRA